MKRFLLLVLMLLCFSNSGVAQPLSHDIRPGYGVTDLRWLSDYLPALRETPGDTRVYVLQGKHPGGTALVLGGTHGDEIAGIMAATWMVERLKVEAGRVIVIPRANNSASTYHASNRPAAIVLETARGTRTFAYGTRRTNPVHQGPDPQSYQHPLATDPVSGEESRNLNRVHPGRADGNLTEQISYAIVQLIKEEKVNVAFDLHEAGPTSRLANMLVAHPKSLELAAEALLTMELETGLSLKLEVSSEEFRGLSHREWGDHTATNSFLIETPNPGQDRSKNDVDLVNDPQLPLAKRVGVQLQTIQAVINTYSAQSPETAVVWQPVPTLPEWLSKPLGLFYND